MGNIIEHGKGLGEEVQEVPLPSQEASPLVGKNSKKKQKTKGDKKGYSYSFNTKTYS